MFTLIYCHLLLYIYIYSYIHSNNIFSYIFIHTYIHTLRRCQHLEDQLHQDKMEHSRKALALDVSISSLRAQQADLTQQLSTAQAHTVHTSYKHLQTYIYTYTYLPTYIHTYIHTFIHLGKSASSGCCL